MNILFFILYIFITLIISSMLTDIVCSITTTKISDFLILNRKLYIQQHLPFKQCLIQSFKLNFYKNKPKNIEYILIQSLNDFENFLSNTNLNVLYTSTNKLMERKLKQLSKKHNLEIIQLNEKPKYKSQILERLALMGITTTIFNLFNVHYWKYVIKRVEINKFKIIINKKG